MFPEAARIKPSHTSVAPARAKPMARDEARAAANYSEMFPDAARIQIDHRAQKPGVGC
jgi:hypothetical protein